MSVFTHLSLSPINIAAALCSAKAYNSAYAKGEQMINETMYTRGAESSIIREIFSYGLERKAQIGAENVFDFSLGNPSVPAPAAVAESIKKALELPSDQLHGYTPAPGLPQCRAAVAESLNRRFGTSYEGKDVFMTVGAAASLTCTLNAVTNPGDEVIVIAPYFPEYRVWIEKAGCTCVEALADEDTFQLSVDNVLKAISDKTAAVIIDSPNNPTGAVYTCDTLTRLANVLREANAQRDPENPIMLISDEPYREIVYGARCLGALDLRAHHRVLLVFQVAVAAGRARGVDLGSQHQSAGCPSDAGCCGCCPYARFCMRTGTLPARNHRLHR